MFGKRGFEDPGKALRWWEDQLERARTFQKGIQDYPVREEIITERRGRETAKRGELGKKRGSQYENMIQPAKKLLNEHKTDKERKSDFHTGKITVAFITARCSDIR